MLPNEGVLSTQILPSAYLVPMRQSNHITYSYGGLAIGNTSRGLMHQVWRSGYDGEYIILYTEADVPNRVLPVSDVTQISFTFDQNMNPFIMYMVDGVSYQYWYDSVAGSMVTTTLDSTVKFPQCSLDDPRPEFTSDSDIIVAYIKPNGDMCYRVQRERYLNEHVIKTGLLRRRLHQIGLTRNYRFRFKHTID